MVSDANAWNDYYAIFQYFDLIAPVDEADHALDCVCLRWAIEDERNYSVAFDSMSEDNVKIRE